MTTTSKNSFVQWGAYEYTLFTTSFARSTFADVAGTNFLRSLRTFIPFVKVSLISSSRGIAIGGVDALSTTISEGGGISRVLE